jgi:large subunit ribosomal protein L9
MNVKVLLKTDVDNLGTGGEVVRVRAGYARNFLLPRGLALPATPGNLSRVEELQRAAAQRKKQEQADAQGLAQKIGELSVTVARAVGGEGKMYGSVTAKDIADAYAKLGVNVDRKRIVLDEPLKQLGTYKVAVRIHPALDPAEVTVVVEPKG